MVVAMVEKIVVAVVVMVCWRWWWWQNWTKGRRKKTMSGAGTDVQLSELGFKHPVLEETSAARDAMIAQLGAPLEAIFYGPNYSVQSQHASVALQRAFHGDKFRNFGEPTGYLLRLGGHLSLTRDTVRLVFGGRDAALGVSQYRVVAGSVPAVLQNGSLAQIESFMGERRDKVSRLLSPVAHVFLTKTRRTARDSDEFAIIVKDTDVPAARRFNEWLLASAALGKPKTLKSAVESTEYKKLLVNAQLWRNYVALIFARALGVELARTPVAPMRTTMLTVVRPYNQATHGMHRDGSRASELFVASNNLASAAEAHDGVSLLYRGALAGYAEIRNSAGAHEWHQPHYMSGLPGDTGRAHKAITMRAAAHPGDSDEAAADFNARVIWNSDFGDHVQHSATQYAHADIGDPFTSKWLEGLAPSDSRALPLETQEHAMIVGQLSDVSSHYATQSALARIAKMPNAPTSVPLAVDHELIAKIPQLYDTVIRSAGYPATLPQIFGRMSTHELEPKPGGYATLYTNTALTFADQADLDAIGAAAHDLANDGEIAKEAASLGMSSKSGCNVKHSAAHHISHYDEVAVGATLNSSSSAVAAASSSGADSRLPVSRAAMIALRDKARGSTEPFEQQTLPTLINVDTALLRIITP
jgi:hypothetical protein